MFSVALKSVQNFYFWKSSISIPSPCVCTHTVYDCLLLFCQITVPITPLREGELEVVGFVYSLCIDGSQSKGGATSPLPSSSSRANLLSMSVNSRESLYQVQPLAVISCVKIRTRRPQNIFMYVN